MELNRKFSIKSLGCKVNQIEGQAIREKFLKVGYEESSEETGLDVVIINTCTVTQTADRKSRTLIRKFHRQNPQATIIVTGCYAEKNRDDILRIEGVHSVVSQNEKEFLVDRFLESSPLSEGTPTSYPYQNLPVSRFEDHTRAFLKIQDGCNRNCSYCKVRVVRGPSRSRSKEDVVEEAGRLIEAGHKEIVLTGIQLGAYGRDLEPKSSLVQIIREILKIPGLLRLRLSSIEPGDVTDELLELIADNERIARHFHIPLQSGSDKILKLMKRGYTREAYLRLIQKIRAQIKDCCLTMDVVVGFSGECAEDFEDTLKLVESVKPLKVHIFPFSRREGTAAFDFPGLVEEGAKRARVDTLSKVAEKAAESTKDSFLGKKLKVLIEEFCEKEGVYKGHTTHYLPVMVESGDNLMDREVMVLAERLQGDFLVGTLFSDASVTLC